MAIRIVDVEGEERRLYVDNRLNGQIEAKIRPKIEKKDFDWVWIVDGSEGSGKSVLAMQLGKIVDPSLTIDRICMTPNEFTKAIIKAKRKQCVIFDEAFTGLSSRAALSEINRLLVSLMMEMRQKNLFVIIVMPTFFLLDRYVALFRARGLFHVYLKDGKRGRWVYFNSSKKKLLYIKGKKLYDYGDPKSKFYGRFLDQYTVNEKEYRKKKIKALYKKSRSTKAEKLRNQRDILLYMICKVFNKTQRYLSKELKDYGWSINQSRISQIVMDKDIEIKKYSAIYKDKND